MAIESRGKADWGERFRLFFQFLGEKKISDTLREKRPKKSQGGKKNERRGKSIDARSTYGVHQVLMTEINKASQEKLEQQH